MVILVLTYDLSFKVICEFEGKKNNLSGRLGSQLLTTDCFEKGQISSLFGPQCDMEQPFPHMTLVLDMKVLFLAAIM